MDKNKIQKNYRKEITELKQINISVFMVPPIKHKKKNIDFTSNDQDADLSVSSEDSFELQRHANEIWIHDYQAIIAKRDMNLVEEHIKEVEFDNSKSKSSNKSNNPKSKSSKKASKKSKKTYKTNYQFLLGIKFPNNEVVYMRSKYFYNGNNMAGCTSDHHNLLLNLPEKGHVFLGLKNKARCEVCTRPLVKIYRCYDCKPSKSYQKIDFCKSCYKKRKHVNHRVIALSYSDELFDEYDYLSELISEF